MATRATTLDRGAGWRTTAALGGRALRAVDRAAVATGVDGWLLTVVVALVAFGLVMVYSASEALGYLWFGNPSYFFEHQLIGVALGFAGMFLIARFDYHRLRGLSKSAMVVMVLLLLAVLLPHIGVQANGAQRWFQIGPLSVQPSAISIAIIIVFFARWLDDRSGRIRSL
ncbi:MAG: FtsW/RodA/SpoVE family cell cycle protein, partial [Candidatus Dormibacteraeota bacterium]|nr:FtsW/RodA/SpoVE family cell cycle protein [Candidatus Dormibacteraeota bacterium]